MNENVKVDILLSAYNGEQYLRIQLDSILAQTHKNLVLRIRDDGSTDGTRDILSEYEKKYDNVIVYYEENIGLVKSFLRLLSLSDADYAGFSDQDDYWLPDKVEKALSKLSAVSGPALYSGNQILVDKDLNPLPPGPVPHPVPGFYNAVVESMCTGCTVLMNRELTDIVTKDLPEHAIWHDWWCYLVCTYCGTYVFDPEAHIYYRQHGDNQLGSSKSALQMMKNKWDFLKKTRGKLFLMLSDFKDRFRGEKEKDEIVDLLLNSYTKVKPRFKLIFHSPIYRQKKFDNFVMRALILINKML